MHMQRSPIHATLAVVLLLAVLALVAASCSGRSDSGSGGSDGGTDGGNDGSGADGVVDTADCPDNDTAGIRRRHDHPGVVVPAVGPHRRLRPDLQGLQGLLRQAQRRGRRRGRRQEVQDQGRRQGRRVQRRPRPSRTSTKRSAPTATRPSPCSTWSAPPTTWPSASRSGRELRAQRVRRHRLAGLGQPRLPVDHRLHPGAVHASRPRPSPTT